MQLSQGVLSFVDQISKERAYRLILKAQSSGKQNTWFPPNKGMWIGQIHSQKYSFVSALSVSTITFCKTWNHADPFCIITHYFSSTSVNVYDWVQLVGLVHQKESTESSAGLSALAFNAIVLLIVKSPAFQEQTSCHAYKKIQLIYVCLGGRGSSRIAAIH